MLKIKLSPTGKKNERHYRIVVTEAKSKLSGDNVEIIGHFHPLLPKAVSSRLVYDLEKIKSWMTRGARPTDRVRNLLKL